MGIWNVTAALYGTQEQVDVNWKIVTEAFGKSGKAKFLTEREAGDDPQFGYRAVLMRGGGGSLWFAPVAQARGSESLKQILGRHGLEYTGEFVVGMRDMHHILDMLYDRTDPAMTKAAYQRFDELVSEFSAQGYGTYRVNTAFMDKVAHTYGQVQRNVHKTIKKALDPNGILAPGKSGIR